MAKCGLFDKSGPKTFHNMCCCACKNRLKLKYWKSDVLFGSRPTYIKYICTLFADEGVAVPTEEHSMCEGFNDKRTKRTKRSK